ncbi:acyl carrier protein [Paenibacillus albicereus]|uniref:Acyl carrier protein n=1 Tax=Paenibacillus albicereus TaxID=2726185 RepID=A0A6H2GZH1_9BACL|nr:phosphopantetheine-binding protein [Paenibacillus albicereus]QJC52810.1 acyl carrier protein [Paenibacillus albicereus]
MPREGRRDELRALMEQSLGLGGLPERLDDELRLAEDLGLDSILVMQLIVWIEVRLGLAVPDAEVDPRAFATVGSVLDFMGELRPLAAEGKG